MSKKKITRFRINEAGLLEVLDFKKRTFKQALKPFLKKGWKHDPDKLVAGMHRSSDLRDAVIVIRDAYLEHFEKLSDELLMRLCEPRSAEITDDELEGIYQHLLAVTVLLSEICTRSLSNWVRTLSSADYDDLIEELRIFLAHEVTENFHAWDAAVDTPQGQAVTLLMDLAPDDQDAFAFELVQNEDASTLGFATTKTAEELNAIVRESGLDIEFVALKAEKPAAKDPKTESAAAPVVEAKTTEMKSSTPAKPKAQKQQNPQESAKPAPAAGTAEKAPAATKAAPKATQTAAPKSAPKAKKAPVKKSQPAAKTASVKPSEK